jgi:AcrR family transcriptional regulator
MTRTARPRARGPGRPAASDRDESRARIIAAAQRIFSTRGYSDATNADIAREAGMTSGAIYHYYDSKKDLFEAAAAHNWERITEQFREVGASDTTVGTLEGLLTKSTEIAFVHPDISRFAVTVATETERHEELREIGKTYRARREKMLSDLVKSAIENREIDMRGLKQKDVVALLMAITDGLARLATISGGLELHRGATRALNKWLEASLFRPSREH